VQSYPTFVIPPAGMLYREALAFPLYPLHDNAFCQLPIYPCHHSHSNCCMPHDGVPHLTRRLSIVQLSQPEQLPSSNESKLPGPLLNAHPIAKASVIENFNHSHGLCRPVPIICCLLRCVLELLLRCERTFFPGPAIPGLRDRFDVMGSGLPA
jgi:hypothetical protein